MQRRPILFIAALLCLIMSSGCSRAEPPGKPVTLTATEASHSNNINYKEVQESNNWLAKAGVLEDEGRYEEALFCLHRGQEKWPKADPRPAAQQRIPWSQDFEPLGKATLYIRMRKPDLALVYLDKVSEGRIKNSYRATAHYMLKDYESADKELSAEPSVLRGAILCAKGNEKGGLEMIKTSWGKEKLTLNRDIAQGTITRAHAVNVFWMEHPDEVQALVKRVDPTAPSF